jgi:colicin import membrane protein
MAKNPPSRGYAVASGRFWRNVVLIALAHVALIAGLIRWTLAARASSNAESIVWLGSAEDLAAGESENEPSPPATRTVPQVEPKPAEHNEAEEEKPVVTTAKSEIELPSPTPNPTPSPKPTATSTPKPKVTPKPAPKPTPKKTLVAKASPKSSAKTKSSPAKSSEKLAKNEKSLTAKTGTASQSDSAKRGSTGTGGSAGGGNSASEFGWYGHMLHDRFYSAWIQPTTNVPSGSKISTLVKVRIEKDGHVSKFDIVKPSENVVVNESVAAIGKRVSEVDPPPAGLASGDHYDVKINFELNTDQTPAK